MIYAGVDSNGTDYNRNAWVVPGGGAGLVREGDGLRACQLRNGTVTPGIVNPMSYNRPRTRDTFTVPFEVSGEIVLHSRATDPVIFGTGLRPHWTWAVNFHPVFVDENNNVVTGFAPGSPNWSASGQIDGKYGIARAERYTPPFDHDAQLDGRRHSWRMVAPEVGAHEVYWDGDLVYRVVEKSPPAKWWSAGRFHASLRLDYYDFTLYNLTPGDPVTRIQPRSVIGTPEPPSTRPKLQRVKVLLAHHVGFTNTTRYRSADPARVLDDARAAASFGVSSGRSWEYNYMIGLDGTIFEQGGEYRAAHCLNFNGDSAGVLFMNADGDTACTPAQIEAWHWLRGDMVRRGTLTADHEVAPHYRYRDTSCPGLARADAPGRSWASPTGQGRVGNLIKALRVPGGTPEPEPSPPPTVKKGPAMFIIIVTNAPTSPVKETGLLCDGTGLSHLHGHAATLLQRVPGMHVERPESAAELSDLLRTCQTKNACPPEWEGTGWEGAWSSARG